MWTNVRTWLYRVFAAAASIAALLLVSMWTRRKQTLTDLQLATQRAGSALSRSGVTTTTLQTLEQRDQALLDALRKVDDAQAVAERDRITQGLQDADVRSKLHERGLTSDR